MHSKRRHVREKVLQALYAFEITGDPISKIKNDIISDLKDYESTEFANKLIDNVTENHEKYDELIKNSVENWELERIALLDHIVIKMCLTEFFFFEEIPPKVSINEAIDLAKDFSTTNSGKFVNGILDNILNKLKDQGDIKKVGKGLLNSTISKKRSKPGTEPDK